MIRKLEFWLYILVAIFSCTACSTTRYTTAREHPSLGKQLEQIEKVVIVPPSVNIDKVVFTGEDEKLKDLEKQISEKLKSSTRKKLMNLGYEIVDFDFDSGMTENTELAFAIKQTRDGFNNAKKVLYEKTSVPVNDKRKFCTSVGTAVNTISATCDADAVVLIQYAGFKKSTGMIAKDVMISALVAALAGTYVQQPTEGSYVEVAVIDGATGEVVWSDLRSAPKLEANIIESAMVSMPADVDPQEPPSSMKSLSSNTEDNNSSPERSMEENKAKSVDTAQQAP